MAEHALYRGKFVAVTPLLTEMMKMTPPDAGFYLWADVAENELAVTRALYANYNVTVLPCPFLVREAQGSNPGSRRIRMAWVADIVEYFEAAHRIHNFVPGRGSWNASSSLHFNFFKSYLRDQSHDPTSANHSVRR